MAYYVHIATRGSKITDSPANAINYILYGHDDSRVQLLGLGLLAGVHDERQLADRFEEACQPVHDPRATLGYKSITLTLPKELSLFAERHREEAKAAMHAAAQYALDRGFVGLRYSAVAAIHARSREGKIHYYAHVLLGKFAQKADTGRTYSVNSLASGNSGYARLKELKCGWQTGVDAEFRTRFGLSIEQHGLHGPVSLLLPDGTKLAAQGEKSTQP